jgi:CBS domain-containing protein
MNVADVMTKEVATVSPDTPLKEVAVLLATRRISGLPVVGADGRLLGVVSEQDVLYKEVGPGEPRRRRFLRRDDGDVEAKAVALTAGDAMTSPALTIGPRRPVVVAARTMVEHGVNRLPVVERDGALVGIVARSDLVRAFARGDVEIAREIVEDVFTRSLWLAPGQVSVEVVRGEVSLAGSVERRTDAELAATLARRVPGVVRVDSRISWRLDDVEDGKRRARLPHLVAS